VKHDWYPASGGGLIGTLWVANPMKVALMKPTYVPNPDTHKVWADVSAQELATAGGYTAGGQDIANRGQSYDPATDRTNLTGDDNTWQPVTIQTSFAVVYDNSGAKALWSLVDFEGMKDSVNGVFVIDWAAIGLLYVTKV
jgi:hypothetical protein